MSEFAGEEFLASGGSASIYEEMRAEINRILVKTFISEPNDSAMARPMGTAELSVVEGLAMDCGGFSVALEGPEIAVSGQVTIRKTGGQAPDSKMIITYRKNDTATDVVANVVNGLFSTVVPAGAWTEIQAYYLPPSGYGDCRTSILGHP